MVEGAIRISAVSENGKEALLILVEAPHWFGEIALFDGQARTHDAYAEGHTQLLQIPQAALLELLRREPHYWRDMALLMSHSCAWHSSPWKRWPCCRPRNAWRGAC